MPDADDRAERRRARDERAGLSNDLPWLKPLGCGGGVVLSGASVGAPGTNDLPWAAPRVRGPVAVRQPGTVVTRTVRCPPGVVFLGWDLERDVLRVRVKARVREFPGDREAHGLDGRGA